MKKFAQRILLLIAAIAVFFTGTGATIVNYCCTSCSEQTLFVSQQHVCCTHEESDLDELQNVETCCGTQSKMQHDECSSEAYSNDSHCTASRVSIDIDASSFRPHMATPFVWLSDTSFLTVTNVPQWDIDSADDYEFFEDPPNTPPRAYLSLIRVLII